MRRRLGCGVVAVAAVLVLGGIARCGAGGDTSAPTPTAGPSTVITSAPSHTARPRHTVKPSHRAKRHVVKAHRLPADARGPYPVIRVVDGDTVHVSVGGVDTDVRMIGVDTPETVDPGKPVQCWGPQASARTRALLDGASLYLEYDPDQPRRDRYGRTLAYLWLSDGRLVNRNLILGGYGRAETDYGLYKYERSFLHAEDVARSHRRGLWGNC